MSGWYLVVERGAAPETDVLAAVCHTHAHAVHLKVDYESANPQRVYRVQHIQPRFPLMPGLTGPFKTRR